MWNLWSHNPSFRLEIDNFLKKKDGILSKVFVAGGSQWFLHVYPKGDLHADDHLSVYLRVANPKSSRIGWKRNVTFYFVVLNHRNMERCVSAYVERKVFDAENPAWGFPKLFPLSELKEEYWFMGKDSVIVEVYVHVIEAMDGESEDVPEKETVDINGFQGCFMTYIFRWMVDCLKSKFEDVSLERKKADDADGSRVQQLEESVKNLETMVSDLKSKLDEVKTKSSDDEFLLV